MDTVTMSKQNRLFWLGRYAERVYATVQVLMEEYDRLIDGEGLDYQAFCKDMGIPCDYTSGEDFCRRYLFDGSSPHSVRSAVECMLGDGMVLRETITSQTLAYLQMAYGALELAEHSEAPCVSLQWVLDDIMAFRGSFDDAVEEERIRNITKIGGQVERISLMLRMGWHSERLERELQKLLNRLYKTGLQPNPQALETITGYVMGAESVSRYDLLTSVEGLFAV